MNNKDDVIEEIEDIEDAPKTNENPAETKLKM